jgi:16S rRNA (guanine527-N7)-methyltransferase
MTEKEARDALDVPRETMRALETFVELLLEENERQNLISRASVEQVWSRHILDSAQLVKFAPAGAKTWLDIGSGPGLPGLVIALLHDGVTTLVEPRKLRANFLGRAVAVLGLQQRVRVAAMRAEDLPDGKYDVITARAVAPLASLFSLSERFGAPATRWVLPKGKNARTELEAAESLWQGEFRLEPSRTDPQAWIVTAEGLRRRQRGDKGR